MSNDENKRDKMQPNTIPRNKIITSENIVTPEVKILNRGDLLGAINCLFPELQLKSSHIKLKENFSLFSYSIHELTKIFESGRRYRSRTVNNIKLCNANQSMRSLRTDSSRTNPKRNIQKIGNASTSSMSMVSASKPLKSKAQKKQFTYEIEQSKRHETVEFESSYTNFVEKSLNSHFPDRFIDFKNIECFTQELHHLYKEMSKDDKIGPFNPNLPVLNISKCDDVLRRKSGSKDIFKTISPSSIKHMRNKKKSHQQRQIEAKGKRNKTVTATKKITNNAINEVIDDESTKQIVQNIESLLSDDTFSPRYKERHSTLRTDPSIIFRDSINRSDSTIYKKLEKEAIEQYENVDDIVDMNFNLSEI